MTYYLSTEEVSFYWQKWPRTAQTIYENKRQECVESGTVPSELELRMLTAVELKKADESIKQGVLGRMRSLD